MPTIPEGFAAIPSNHVVVMQSLSAPSPAARRESLFVVVVWVLACVYTVGYAAVSAYRPGYPRPVLGIPEWVAWGVLAPWLATLVFTLWFALCYVKDEPLGDSDVE